MEKSKVHGAVPLEDATCRQAGKVMCHRMTETWPPHVQGAAGAGLNRCLWNQWISPHQKPMAPTGGWPTESAMQHHAALFSPRHGLALIFRFRWLKVQWIHTCMALCIFYLQGISFVEGLLNWTWHRHAYSQFASISKAKIIFTCLLATWKPLQSEWFDGTAILHLYIHLVMLKPTKHVVILTKENSASDVAWTQHNPSLQYRSLL
jgi:hypothetical protein